MKAYKVLVQHFGDKQYWAGDTRVLSDGDAAILMKRGIVGELPESDETPAEYEELQEFMPDELIDETPETENSENENPEIQAAEKPKRKSTKKETPNADTQSDESALSD